ncbi:hypothetical protein [Brevundimonas balnearis]|uniref:Uncharacterized protein n=1 Tax=Brevundimonas balnearis TaxID=1572858 RepID=A0ABV6R3J2_9CAUL
MSLLVALLALSVSDPDGVVTTGRVSDALPAAVAAGASPILDEQAPVLRAGTQLSTAEQIDRFLAPARAADARDRAERQAGSLEWRDDRRVHGEVNVGVGSHDFTTYGATISVPVGENGRATFSYQQSEGGRYYAPYGAPVWGAPVWGAPTWGPLMRPHVID